MLQVTAAKLVKRAAELPLPLSFSTLLSVLIHI